ncbi:cleavage and polyadenylation specificity factor subunit [Rickenella mellea]|uniref:Cleavage and polyadenylation specificity factor subunit 2 n=1 Tax=Rickenella mellea TaxID=50990 RepID=A0A4R5XH36_9AGAM|nr:cleavage and polyadenylation specificity factor subunit [Rickenella mellea]
MITFTPLSGGAASPRTTPLAYLLQVDDVRILLDCGSPDWCPEVSPDFPSHGATWEPYCTSLKSIAPTIDLVLFTHGDLSHTGLYAYAFSRWGLRCPAYATLPVQAMARIASLEEVVGIRAQEEVEDKTEDSDATGQPDSLTVHGRCIATAKEVHGAFDTVNTLRYSQPTHLQGKCQGLTITAFNAGHTLGGSMWKIRSPSAGTILYAVDINHTRERHLDGTVLVRGSSGVFEPLARPDLFITDAERVMNVSCRRKDRDAQLIDTVTSTLSSRHSVLMPCDSSTRLLELLVLLDQHWNYSRLKYPICLISRTGKELLATVRSMMEWLGGTISKEDLGDEGGGSRNGHKRKRDDDNDEDALGALSLRFRHLEFFSSPQALLHTYSSKDPKLILAVPNSLSHGPSRILFSEFASVPDNAIILTSRSEDGTLGRALFDMWNNQQREDDKWDKGKLGRNVMMDRVVTLKMHSKIPLQGVELDAYLEKERIAQAKEVAQQAALARTQRMLEADEDVSDSDSDNSDDEDAVESALAMGNADTHASAFSEPGVGQGRRRAREIGDVMDWNLETDDGGIRQLVSFDIYLKGNVSKPTSFFKTTGPQIQRFRTFPYVERRRRVDAYGEILDVGMWLRKGKAFEEEAESDETREARRRKAAEEEAKKAPLEPPSKFIELDIEVQLACRLLFVDLEGLNDGRAVKSIVPQVNPRKMIIVHASSEAARVVTDACNTIRAMTKDIYSPSVGDATQIGQHTNSFSISLGDALLSSTKMSRFEDNEVGYVVGCVTSHESSTIPVLEPISASSPAAETSISEYVTPPTLGSRIASKLPQSTLIGELKLTALKSRLATVGIQAEFAGEGVLVCGGRPNSDTPLVAVKKTGKGRVDIEGPVSDLYYTVRKEVYDLHALVAA